MSADLAARLRARTPQIERAIGARVQAVADPAEVADPSYAEGLRAAVAAALAHAVAGVEAGEPEPGPVPAELFAQARAAAHARVPLDTVLRRYLAGHALIVDFAMDEAGGPEPVSQPDVQRALRVLAALVDRLIAAVSEQYRRVAEQRPRTPERRHAELIRRLLADEPADPGELGYELQAHHLGLIASGPGARPALGELARALDRRLLLVPRPGGALWAWLGGRRALDPAEALARLGARAAGQGGAFAFGEPGQGPAGWRLSHRQALAALPVAQRGPERAVRYADVALLASAIQDEILATSLRCLYLEPLERERDGGKTLRETLRAYFAADRNVSSAAAALGVSRQSVNSRLRAAEQRLGRPIDACAAELQTALRLQVVRPPVSPPVAK